MTLANPMDIAGPAPAAQYQQPGTANPAPQKGVGDYAVANNPLGIEGPGELPKYSQPT